MKINNKIAVFIISGFLVASCDDYLEPNKYSLLTEDLIYSVTTYVNSMPNGIYSCVPQDTGDSYMTAASDEAESVDESNSMQLFNTGNWNKYNNPDDVWSSCYKGIRIACDYLAETDTLTWNSWRYSNPTKYAELMQQLCMGRAEARFLRSYLYLELVKRYGDVPLITDKVTVTPNMEFSKFPRTPVGDIITYISDQCDIVCREGKYFLSSEQIATQTNNGRNILPSLYRDTLALAYPTTGDMSKYLGRATRGSAYALKAKALIYYASKLFNPNNDVDRWKNAALACKKVLDLPKSLYDLEPKYADLFNMKSKWSKEFLFVRKVGASNSFEKANYPVSIEGGATGLCPSQNLVDAYEVIKNGTATSFDWNNPEQKANPYANRDPRFYSTIYKHGDQYNASNINTIVLDCSEGGNSAFPLYHATKTGYYLKKYINSTLDLKNGKTDTKTWILMRMADFYLYYAEAMNEAYGPSSDPASLGMTALDAVNKIRARAGMPIITTMDQSVFRTKIYNERQVEFAFENQRWWDVRRWMYGQAFNTDLKGAKVEKAINGTLLYTPITIENRSFDETKMYLYPIPQSEIEKSGGVLVQNANW
jgi:SusD family.